jgi:hypothetical protein
MSEMPYKLRFWYEWCRGRWLHLTGRMPRDCRTLDEVLAKRRCDPERRRRMDEAHKRFFG